MLTNFHKAISECWRRTQKGSPFSSKEGRTKYKRQRDKRVRDRDLSWGRSHEGGEVSKQQKTLSPASLWGVLDVRGQHNWEKKKKNPQNTHLTATPSGEAAQTLASTTSKQGPDREVRALT